MFLFEDLQVATNPTYLAAWGTAGVNAMVLMLLDMQHCGLLIAQIFFAPWLAPMGYLAYAGAQRHRHPRGRRGNLDGALPAHHRRQNAEEADRRDRMVANVSSR